MKKPIFCTLPGYDSLFYAKNRLQSWGYTVLPTISETVTHLLLPVPTPADAIPRAIPEGITVLGGKLGDPAFPAVDFLKDEYYLQENAAITALCALQIAREHLSLHKAAVLIIGWGRIGKVLAAQLKALGANVAVAVRKQKDMEALHDKGYKALWLSQLDPSPYDLIFNTAPAPVMNADQTKALCIDLASIQGIEGAHMIWARGLPGKMAPEASGALIAKTALRYALGKE